MELTDAGTGKKSCTPCGTCPYSSLTSVTLSEEWTKVTIVFSGSITAPAGVTDGTAAMCEYFFSSTALLGDGYRCSLSGSTLTVYFGAEAGFVSSSVLPMNKGALKVPPCTCGYDTAISISAADPVLLSASVGTVSLPHTSCVPLTIALENFVGLGKRPSTLSISYQIVSASTTSSAYPRLASFSKSMARLNAFLKSQTGTSVTFPSLSFMEDAVYTLQYTLTNFATTSISTFDIITATYAGPAISLSGIEAGSVQTIHEWDVLTLVPLLGFADCDPQAVGQPYEYSWGQNASASFDCFNDSLLQTLYSSRDGVLSFPEYTFLSERVYRFSLGVTNVDYNVSRFTNVTVRIVHSGVSFLLK